MLIAKVDSMDNTYDKRIANLEVTLAPIVKDNMTSKKVKDIV
jgi:hypothetical protein